MKAVEANLLKFIKKSSQFAIPIYQRTYSWTERECRQLWDDILRAGSKDAIAAHFIGSVVYIEKGLYQVTSQEPLLVIDGQLRLTTVSLIIEALSRHIGESEPIDGFSALKLRSYYLLNSLESDERRFKLLLTQTDKDTLLALVEQKQWPSAYSYRLIENFEFFDAQIRALNGVLEPLCKGLAKLMIVDISLSRDQDNPQLIFESMNSTGRELTQADLIRNFVLMGLEPSHQTRLYKDHWRPMEVAFGQEGYTQHFDSFMRHYLTYKTGDIPKINAVYDAFKAHSREQDIADAGVDALIADVHQFAIFYCAMALDKEPDKELSVAFKDLRELKVDVAYPFLLELYQDYATEALSKDDFLTAVRLIESYVFRRAACAIPTNSLNKTFANFGRNLKKDCYLESIMAHFKLLPSYRRFPNDEEFQREIKVRDLYNFPRRSFWLRRLENHNRKERVPVDEYTIEHILPQNPNLSSEWRNELGPEWARIQETWLHTLGNLTLTGYNPEYSDRSFTEKRDMNGGFTESPLRVNEGLGTQDVWNEDAIKARADRLASRAAEVWILAKLDTEILDKYRPRVQKPDTYTIEDHLHLSVNSAMRSLFDEFSKHVMALDPCVTEEFLKLYVAYKAETNFVDVIPQAKCLLLSLRISYYELHDPRGIAKDVANLGRWGNGDVEVRLSSIDELPYIMGLVRQVFEKQMGNGGED